MLTYLEISKAEYASILRNRGKSVSPSISFDKLLQKVKYLTKKDLKHLLTIRNIDIDDDDSVDNIINVLLKDIHKKKQAKVIDEIYRYHHKQKLNNLKQKIYRNIQKRQNQSIINELKKLKLSDFIKKGPISYEDLKEIIRLKELSRNTLIKLAQLRNMETTGLNKPDLIYVLLRSQKDPKEAKYLQYLNNNTDNNLKSKINEIRKVLVELGMMLDKEYKDEIRETLNKIDKKTRITHTDKTKLLNQLSKISLDLHYKRKHLDSAYDDSNYYGLKDLEYIFGDLDDYYKPILAKESSDGNYQLYTCRADRDRDMTIDTYLDKVIPYLRILIDKKKITDQKIQLDIGTNLRHITEDKRITFYVKTVNIMCLPSDNTDDI